MSQSDLDLVDSTAIALLLDVHPETVRKAARTGAGLFGVQPVRIGSTYRWDLRRIKMAVRGASR